MNPFFSSVEFLWIPNLFSICFIQLHFMPFLKLTIRRESGRLASAAGVFVGAVRTPVLTVTVPLNILSKSPTGDSGMSKDDTTKKQMLHLQSRSAALALA